MRKTAQFIEEQKASVSVEPKRNKKGDRRGMPEKSRANLGPPRWKKGQSGNPGGKPGTDLAALYARRFFEAHPEGISKDMGNELKGFNAYGFSVLADRGYGKAEAKQQVEMTGADGTPLSITVRLVKAENA